MNEIEPQDHTAAHKEIYQVEYQSASAETKYNVIKALVVKALEKVDMVPKGSP